jgi:hypothetical protein
LDNLLSSERFACTFFVGIRNLKRSMPCSAAVL